MATYIADKHGLGYRRGYRWIIHRAGNAAGRIIITWKQITIISMGWAISAAIVGAFGGVISDIPWNVRFTISEAILTIIWWAYGWAACGGIGGVLMFWQFNRIKRKT